MVSDVNKSSGKDEAQWVTIRFNDLEDVGDLAESHLVNIVWEGEARQEWGSWEEMKMVSRDIFEKLSYKKKGEIER